MSKRGEKIKEKIVRTRVNITRMAGELGISRQAVYDTYDGGEKHADAIENYIDEQSNDYNKLFYRALCKLIFVDLDSQLTQLKKLEGNYWIIRFSSSLEKIQVGLLTIMNTEYPEYTWSHRTVNENALNPDRIIKQLGIMVLREYDIEINKLPEVIMLDFHSGYIRYIIGRVVDNSPDRRAIDGRMLTMGEGQKAFSSEVYIRRLGPITNVIDNATLEEILNVHKVDSNLFDKDEYAVIKELIKSKL